MGFTPNALYYSDGYKTCHKRMLAPGTDYLYGTMIPRTLKRAPKGIEKIVSIGQEFMARWLHDEFTENFFEKSLEDAKQFSIDMSSYLGLPYNGKHFEALHAVGFLPITIKALPEGIETKPGIPHMTFVNTIKGFAWLTLYLETIISAVAWKMPTSATTALQYRRNAVKYVTETDPEQLGAIDFLCHDFSARGLDPFSMAACGLGHASCFRGSDTLLVIPAARYYYGVPKDEVCINSVNASEHSVSTTKIFTVGEKQMIIDWLKEFPTGILSIVADTFDLWVLLLEYLTDPEVKALIMARDGKLVIRPDSGDPVDIICGLPVIDFNHFDDMDEFPLEDVDYFTYRDEVYKVDKEAIATYYHDYGSEQATLWEAGIEDFFDKVDLAEAEVKGVIEILWDIFGGTTNAQGYKVLDSHIGCIYGDAINLDRQVRIYDRLILKEFAVTNIVLGIGLTKWPLQLEIAA